MFPRILSAAVALAAMAPLASAGGAGPSVIDDRPDAVYQHFVIAVQEFLFKNGCGGEKAINPSTGRVLPPLWLRFTFHDSGNFGEVLGIGEARIFDSRCHFTLLTPNSQGRWGLGDFEGSHFSPLSDAKEIKASSPQPIVTESLLAFHATSF
ncbi:hypothetical protein BDK51DRAFT_38535 [Blyttiomyces helicus]|uniref:Uncharacterized protein n=1 Tax=Blyttiomyces helicus TaxID=388810 RepID=A0A4P9VVB7_9FUNG|nr:hypothetical protein BDK51DRAFT_38535 [Blyttiomyces helicus]|eukprot:RKO83579.1 hypothetical protein BDK51DRAFT_38535 [Blyttiomyces helicus]